LPDCAVDLLVDAQRGDAPDRAVEHENARVARHAVETSMLTSAVRVDRLIEPDIGRVVGADDRASPIGLEAGRNAVRLLLHVPAVVHALDGRGFEASRGVGERSAPLEGLPAARFLAHAQYCTPIQLPGKGAVGTGQSLPRVPLTRSFALQRSQEC